MARPPEDSDPPQTDDETPDELAVSEADAGASAEGDEPSAVGAEIVQAASAELEPSEVHTASALGTAKYVHAAFFAAGLLAAYLGGKVTLALWHTLADWQTAVSVLPILQRYAEEERESVSMVVGALIGFGVVVKIYRTPSARTWAGEVADELSKVTWPTRETVQNGTVVVVVATAFAILYIALLDRFWGFVTNLVYGV